MNLHVELAEAARVLGAQTIYFPGADAAHAWGVRVFHAGRFITARYAPDHPWSPPWVFVDPEPSNGHYYVHGSEERARLCWCRPDEWSASFHLIVALGCAIRFLNEEVL